MRLLKLGLGMKKNENKLFAWENIPEELRVFSNDFETPTKGTKLNGILKYLFKKFQRDLSCKSLSGSELEGCAAQGCLMGNGYGGHNFTYQIKCKSCRKSSTWGSKYGNMSIAQLITNAMPLGTRDDWLVKANIVMNHAQEIGLDFDKDIGEILDKIEANEIVHEDMDIEAKESQVSQENDKQKSQNVVSMATQGEDNGKQKVHKNNPLKSLGQVEKVVQKLPKDMDEEDKLLMAKGLLNLTFKQKSRGNPPEERYLWIVLKGIAYGSYGDIRKKLKEVTINTSKIFSIQWRGELLEMLVERKYVENVKSILALSGRVKMVGVEELRLKMKQLAQKVGNEVMMKRLTMTNELMIQRTRGEIKMLVKQRVIFIQKLVANNCEQDAEKGPKLFKFDSSKHSLKVRKEPKIGQAKESVSEDKTHDVSRAHKRAREFSGTDPVGSENLKKDEVTGSLENNTVVIQAETVKAVSTNVENISESPAKAQDEQVLPEELCPNNEAAPSLKEVEMAQ